MPLTVLLFGQDKHALAVGRIILEQAGYDVISATDPQQALESAGTGVAADGLVLRGDGAQAQQP